MQKESRGEFSRDPDARGLVVYAIARVPEDRYIDLSEQEALDAIDELADQAHIDKFDRDQIAAVYERFILETEKKLGNSIDLYETEVSPPAQEFCPEYSIRLLGLPKCYCVRKPKVLAITDTMEIA